MDGSSRKWSDSTWTHGKQLEQLLQQVTTLSLFSLTQQGLLATAQTLSLDFPEEPMIFLVRFRV